MAISQVGSATSTTQASGTSLAITLPTGWQANDVVVIVIGSASSTTPSASGWTGWNTQTANNSRSIYVFYRVMQTGDTAPTFTVPSSHVGYIATAWRGADTTTPLENWSTYAGGGPSFSTLITPGQQSSFDGSIGFSVYCGAGSVTMTAPGGQTQQAAINQVSGPTLAVNTATLSVAGFYGSGVETASATTNWNVSTFTLRPSGGSSSATITFVGTTNSSAQTSGAVTITLPTGWQANDVTYLFVGSQYASTTFTAPSGYTLVGSQTSAQDYIWVYRRVMQVGDSNPSLGTPNNSVQWAAVTLRGANTTTPEDGSGINKGSTSGSNPSSLALPSITTTTTDFVLRYGIANNSASTVFVGTPNGWMAFLIDAAVPEHALYLQYPVTAGSVGGEGFYFNTGSAVLAGTAIVAVAPPALAASSPFQVYSQAVQRASSR